MATKRHAHFLSIKRHLRPNGYTSVKFISGRRDSRDWASPKKLMSGATENNNTDDSMNFIKYLYTGKMFKVSDSLHKY